MPLLAVLAGVTLPGCGSSEGARRYVGTASNAVVYVSWTRSNDSLSGQLVQARADDDVHAGGIDTERVSFDGAVDGSAVSLRLDEGLGATLTLTGTLDGDTLALDYPGTDGGIITITLRKDDTAAFNAAVAALREKVSQEKERADQAAAEQQAREEAAGLADGVRFKMAGLEEAATNATANGPDLYQSDLDTVSSDLDTVKSSYEVVTEDANNGHNDTICDDAANVGDDVTNMKDDIGAMRDDVESGSDPRVLASAILDLRHQFAQMNDVDPSLLPDGAPTQDEVAAAISAARRKVRTKGREGANFTKAEALLAEAEAIKAKADAACQAHGR